MYRRRKAQASDEPNDTEASKAKRGPKRRPAPKGKSEGGRAETGDTGKEPGAIQGKLPRTETDGQEEARPQPEGPPQRSLPAKRKSSGWNQPDWAADLGSLTCSQTAAGRFVPIFLKPKRGSLKELPNKEQKRAAGARHEQERPPQPSSLTVSETCESPEPGMQGSMGLRSETPELMDLLVTGVQVLDSVVVLQCQERDIDCPGRGVVGTSLGTEVSGAADGLCDLQLGPRIEPSMPGDSQNPASDLGQAEGKPLVRGAPGDYNSSGGSQSGGPPEAASVPSHAEQGMSSFGTATLQEEPKLCWPGEEWKSELVIGSESELQPIHAHKKPEVRSEVGETGGHPPERGLESDKLNRALKFPGTNDASAKPQDSPHGKAPEFSGTESPDPTLFAPVAPVQMEVELSRLTSVTPFSQLFPTSSAKGKTEPQGRAITVSCSEVLAPAASIGEDGTGGARVGKALAGTAEASFFNASSSQETLQQASWRVEAREGRAWVRPDQTAGGPCESTHAPLWVLGNPESSFNKETGAGAHCTSLPEIRRRDVDGGSSVLPDHDPQPPAREDVKGILQDHEPQPPAGEDLKGILQDHEPWAPLREDLKGILQDREIRPPAREDLKGILQDPEPRPPTREDLKGILQDHEPQPPARKDLKGILQDCEPRPPVREDWKGILQDHESQPPARKELTVILHDCECQPPVGEDLKGILQDRETWPPAREDLKGILQDREPWPPVREDSLLPKQAILSQGPSKAPDWGKEARPDVTGERPPAAGIHAGGLCATASAPGSDWSVPAAQPPMPHREILTQDYKYLPASQMEQILDEFSVETAEPQMLAEDHPHGCPQDEDVQRADGNTEGLKLSPPLTGDPMYWLSDTQLREELKEDEEVLSSPRTTMEQDGTPIVHGLIVELSNLNRLIMNTHRDLESIRRLRYRRAKTGTKYLPHASFMGKRRKEL